MISIWTERPCFCLVINWDSLSSRLLLFRLRSRFFHGLYFLWFRIFDIGLWFFIFFLFLRNIIYYFWWFRTDYWFLLLSYRPFTNNWFLGDLRYIWSLLIDIYCLSCWSCRSYLLTSWNNWLSWNLGNLLSFSCCLTILNSRSLGSRNYCISSFESQTSLFICNLCDSLLFSWSSSSLCLLLLAWFRYNSILRCSWSWSCWYSSYR